MQDERAPDRTHEIEIPGGYKIFVDEFGEGDRVLLCLNGGPGLPCDYLREPHAPLADQGYRVLAFDQLGCGRSDKPIDRSLWEIGRYVEEVETVRTALNMGKVNLLGHSWGGWLGIEYGITYPDNL
ncbi:MAG: alpha/beta fold hydrolase, partial [bacterium]|nr:alpha/beta fold hydrolase [bacterium]